MPAPLAALMVLAVSCTSVTPTVTGGTIPPEGLTPTPRDTPSPSALPTPAYSPRAGEHEAISPPSISMGWGFDTTAAVLGSYCWSTEPDSKGLAQGVCEAVAVPKFDEHTPLLDVSGGGLLVLQLERPYPDRVTLRLYRDLSEQPIRSEEIANPGERIETFLSARDIQPGDYILSVFTYWQGRGDAIYYLAISVPRDESAPPPLRLIIDDQTTIAGKLGGYCWVGDCADGPVLVEQFSVLYDRTQPIWLQFDNPMPTWLDLRLYDDLLLVSEAIAARELSPGEGMITWDVDLLSGYYVLAAFATWELQGDASYYFGLIIP